MESVGNLAFAGSSVAYLHWSLHAWPRQWKQIPLVLPYGIAAILVVVGMFQFEATKGQMFSLDTPLPVTVLPDVSLLLMMAIFFPYLLFQELIYMRVQKLRLLAYTFYFVCVRQFQIFPRIISTSRTIRYRWQINDHSVFYQHDSFVGILLITKSLIQSLLYLVVLNFIFVFCYDYVKSKEFETIDVSVNNLKRDLFDAITILKNCIPLFVSGFLLAYIFNEPRIAIDSEIRLGHFIAGTQRIIIFCLCLCFLWVSFILILRPLTTQLAILWKNKELKKFDAIIAKMFVIVLGVGLVLTKC